MRQVLVEKCSSLFNEILVSIEPVKHRVNFWR